MLIISPQRAEAVSRQGMSKEDVRRFLQQNATKPARGPGDPVQAFKPDTIDVVVAVRQSHASRLPGIPKIARVRLTERVLRIPAGR